MTAIAPGGWLGLLGGGQLGRMFCMAAQSLGYKVVVLDPGMDGPAASVADRHIAADYLDARGLTDLAALALAATTEFENVPAAALDFLAMTARVTPCRGERGHRAGPHQRKDLPARSRVRGGAGSRCCAGEADVDALDTSLLPGIVKSARFGYDGKGQVHVAHQDEAREAWRTMQGHPCVLEKRITLACEISVIVARNEHGDVTSWPAAENRHREGILDISIVPARVDASIVAAAGDIATRVAAALDYRGILCVEMFVTGDGHLLVNEIAPRPHNSGHYTIDACVTSQFEQQARVLAGLPFGDTRQAHAGR